MKNSKIDDTSLESKPDSSPTVTTSPEVSSYNSDTSFIVFNDNRYRVSFEEFTPEEPGGPSYRGRVILTYRYEGKDSIILNDTLDYFRPILQLQDFNNDGIKDITLLYTSSARSVWTHHLYLVDNENHKLIRVKDFENIYNPTFDSINNIITSTAYYNKIYYSFYRIDSDAMVVDLGFGFEDDPSEESGRYDSAIQNIINQHP